MPDLKNVSFCGLYCGLCSSCNRLPRQSGELRESMRKDGWEHWGHNVPGFPEFWSFLSHLADSEDAPRCRDGKCGAPFCGIRKCAQAKGVDVCPSCGDYPCHRIDGLAKGYGVMPSDAKRMKEIGLEAWIAEQEERRKTGFCYVDIRCHPYTVPED